MKYEWETEEEFKRRQKKAKAHGIVIFRDDANMDKILDLIDNYMDLVEAVAECEKEQ
jgi:hypothetical protein